MTTALFITLISLHLVAVMSPWPDFFIVIKNTLQKGRVSWYATALGIASGLLIHIGYSLLWVGYLISKSILLMSTLKVLWWMYLLRIWYKSRTASWSAFDQPNETTQPTSWSGFWQWFITNVFNPKATLYFLSVFTTMITPWTALDSLLFLWITMIVIAAIWFILVSYFVGHPQVIRRHQTSEKYINKCFGALLIAFWAKVLISKA